MQGMQSQIGAVSLVSSQERRSVVVPRINNVQIGGLLVINWWSTAGFVPSFPDMPCMKNFEVYKNKKGVGPLVSSQERRALPVPVINRGSTARCVPPSVYIGFRLFVLLVPGHALHEKGLQE